MTRAPGFSLASKCPCEQIVRDNCAAARLRATRALGAPKYSLYTVCSVREKAELVKPIRSPPSNSNLKKAPHLQQVNQAVLQHLHPEHVEVEICRADKLAQRRGLTSELDEMWSYVGKKAEPRWLWHAINHASGTVLAYVFGRRKDTVFLQLKELLEPFGIHRFYTDGWGAYERHTRSKSAGCSFTSLVRTSSGSYLSSVRVSWAIQHCRIRAGGMS